jgi:hypothetical protein
MFLAATPLLAFVAHATPGVIKAAAPGRMSEQYVAAGLQWEDLAQLQLPFGVIQNSFQKQGGTVVDALIGLTTPILSWVGNEPGPAAEWLTVLLTAGIKAPRHLQSTSRGASGRQPAPHGCLSGLLSAACINDSISLCVSGRHHLRHVDAQDRQD